MIQKLRNDKRARWLFTFCCVVLSGFFYRLRSFKSLWIRSICYLVGLRG